MSHDWLDRAACRDEDPDTFFPEGKPGQRRPGDYSVGETQALRVCGRCPVRAECLEQALSYTEQQGVAGGLVAFERRELKKRRGRRPAPRKPPECGTDRGYIQHRRLSQTPCETCKAAHRAADAARYQRRKGAA